MAKFTEFVHIGVLVENLEVAIEHYEKLGFGKCDPIVSVGGNGEPATVNGEDMGAPGHLMTRYTKCRALGVEFELCEPGPWGPYRDWAEKHGYGLHHVAICSEDGFLPMRQDCIDITNNRPLYIDGFWPQENVEDLQWSYVDMNKEMGLVIEVLANSNDPVDMKFEE